MSPEQEVSSKLLTMGQIAARAGFNLKNPKDLAVAYQRIGDIIKKTHIVPYNIVGRKYFFLPDDAEKIVSAIAGPIRRTTCTSADGLEDQDPQKDDFIRLSQAELQERSNKQREINRLKRQALKQKEEKAEIIKKGMPLYFTNEVLEYIVGNQLNDLNRNLHILLDHALNKVNSGNGKITLAFVLDGQSKEDAQKYFIQHFNFLLQRGFNNTNTQNHKPLSKEEKKLIEQCNCLKDQNLSQERVLKEVCIHFNIPPSYIPSGA